jgi:outer membrane lipoprotein-sorting protein
MLGPALPAAAAPGAENQQSALELVEKARDRLLESPPCRFDFTQVTRSALTETETTAEGTIEFRPPDALKWVYRQPEPYRILMRGERLQMVMPADKQVFEGRLDEVFDPRLPIAVLFRKVSLGAYYRAELRSAPPGAKSRVVRLIPLRPNARVAWIDVHLGSDFSIMKVIVEDPLGNENRFTFTAPEAGTTEDGWQFEVPAGYQHLDFNGDPFRSGRGAQ